MLNEVTRKLTRAAKYSHYVVFPPEWMRTLGWRKGQKIILKKKGQKITVEDWKPKKKRGA
jgi:bifunctional DNA-binding transcriptional regulator/antitoxin component of YhaV-PrlF toxin-antitoxin module